MLELKDLFPFHEKQEQSEDHQVLDYLLLHRFDCHRSPQWRDIL
jgi:hypothetical protein